MLPVFEKSRAVLNKSFERFSKQQKQNFLGPLLGNIAEVRNWEGSVLKSDYQDKTSFTTKILPIGGKLSIDIEETLKNPALVFQYLQQLAAQAAHQQLQLIIGTVHDLTISRNQVVGGGPITAETIIAAYRRLEIDFDGDDKPILQSFVADPETSAKIEAAVRDMMETPKYREAFEQLIEEKRKVFHDRENNRKLVD